MTTEPLLLTMILEDLMMMVNAEKAMFLCSLQIASLVVQAWSPKKHCLA